MQPVKRARPAGCIPPIDQYEPARALSLKGKPPANFIFLSFRLRRGLKKVILFLLCIIVGKALFVSVRELNTRLRIDFTVDFKRYSLN